MLSSQIKSYINQLWNKFWSGGISNPLTAIEQISYLLFLRRLDEMDLKAKSDAEWTNTKYTSIFEGTFKLPNFEKPVDKATLRWNFFKQLEGGEMLGHIQNKVFPFIKQLNGNESPFAKHMKDAVFIIQKPSLLVESIGIIDNIYKSIEEETIAGQTFQDTQGDMFEMLLGEIAAAGKNGQFRTPRHIIQMMCELVNPKLGNRMCDPTCGTAGFLLGGYQHILTQHTSEAHITVDENGFKRGVVGDKLTDERQWKALKEKTFYGYDFDVTMVRIALMNLMLHGITHPNIEYTDTLSKKYNEENEYDIVLANPPFKGSIDKGDINENFKLNTTKTELLCVNRIVLLLRVGGIAGVIVPDGVLFGSSNAHKDLRKMLLDECELQGVISMPSGVFKPYAGVSTAILIFVKGGYTEKVWFYDMTADGYSLDDKRDKIETTDIPDIIKEWNNRNKTKNTDRKQKHFFIPADEIRNNNFDLSINRYKEIVYEEVKYEKPDVILKKVEALESEIMNDVTDLNKLLKVKV